MTFGTGVNLKMAVSRLTGWAADCGVKEDKLPQVGGRVGSAVLVVVGVVGVLAVLIHKVGGVLLAAESELPTGAWLPGCLAAVCDSLRRIRHQAATCLSSVPSSSTAGCHPTGGTQHRHE